MTLTWQGVILISCVLVLGVGGCLGAIALGAHDIAGNILSAAVAMAGGLMVNTRR